MATGILLEPETVIGDRYVLRRPLGEGGMGWVWEARHVFTGKSYALKFLKRTGEDDQRRFEREIRASAAVRHPNVIDVHDFIELPDGTLTMVMELLGGETLAAVVKREKPLSLADTAAILVPVTSALEVAHGLGIVHRDLKPENVFLARRGDETVVKVLDFGAAKLTAGAFAAQSEAMTRTGSIVGTPYYMSPEQVFSEKDLDSRADIWSLGVVLYECLTGVRPTEADTVGQVLKRIMKANFTPIGELCDIPSEVAVLVMAMLASERGDRPNTMREVREVLGRHAGARVPSFGFRLAAPLPGPKELAPGAPAEAQASETKPEEASSSGERPASTRGRSDPKVAVGNGSDSLAFADTHRAGSLSISVTRSPMRWRAGVGGVALTALAGAGLFALRGGDRVGASAVSTSSASGTAPVIVADVGPSVTALAPAPSTSASTAASAPRATSEAGSPAPLASSSAAPRPLQAATPHPATSARPAAAPSTKASAPSPVWTER